MAHAEHSAGAIVIGSSGAIGSALKAALEKKGIEVTGLSRSQAGAGSSEIDLSRESTVEAAANQLRHQAPFSMIILATGLLHDHQLRPEKGVRDIDQDSLTRLFAVNTIGAALVAKHFVPLLPRTGRCVFAALSARVGSIGDNRLGGWYGYRASKAALNMIIKTLAIELTRTNPDAICVSLHPGTVDSDLSRPFQRAVAPDQLFSPQKAANCLLNVVDRLTPAETGRCFAWDGEPIEP